MSGQIVKVQFPVRFCDVDRAGIMFYPTIYDYIHQAFEEFWTRGPKIPYPEVIQNDKVGFPTVRVETDFKAPLKYGETMLFEVGISALGRKSVTWSYGIFNDKGHNLCVRALVVTAVVNMDSFKSMPLPDKYRDLLSGFLIP